MNDKIKVLVVEPMKPCRVQEIPNTLEAMKQTVGGRIESFSYQREAIISNEEGKLLNLPLNRPLYDDRGTQIDMLRGTFFIAGADGEHLTSLTDDQIGRFKALYDNITAERPTAQAEIVPEAAMLDFAVSCQISFRMIREEQASPVHDDAFVSHVTGIFNRDETLSERTVGNLNFTFRGRYAEVWYTFAWQDRDEASAESFSEQCVRNVQDELEGYGCKIEKIECIAEELEPDPVREPVKGRGNQEKKKGTRHER